MKQVIFFLLAFIIVGCEDEQDSFVFDCVVYNDALDMPVAGASVNMSVQRPPNLNAGFDPVSVTTTDANGRFRIEVPKEIYYAFRLNISHPLHFSDEFLINPDNVPFTTPFASTFVLNPKGWLRLQVQNQQGSQRISLYTDPEGEPCESCCSDSPTVLEGADVDTTVFCAVQTPGTVVVNGNAIGNGGNIFQVNATATVSAFDTVDVPVIY